MILDFFCYRNKVRELLYYKQANEKTKQVKDFSPLYLFQSMFFWTRIMLGYATLSEEEQFWWTRQHSTSPEATNPVQTLNCSSFPGGRDDLYYKHITILNWFPAGNHKVFLCFCASSDRCRLCTCASKFMLAVIQPVQFSSFQFRQCLEQGSCAKFLPHVPCLGFLVRNHKIKGQAMGYKPWIDVGWFAALEKPGMKSEAFCARTLPLAVGATNDLMNETGKAITLVESIWWSQHRWAWLWLPQGVSQELPLQNNCINDGIDTYMTWQIRVMSDLPEGIDLLIAVCAFFGPHFIGTFNYRCNLSNLYIFMTDRYIGLCPSCKIMATSMCSCCFEPVEGMYRYGTSAALSLLSRIPKKKKYIFLKSNWF